MATEAAFETGVFTVEADLQPDLNKNKYESWSESTLESTSNQRRIVHCDTPYCSLRTGNLRIKIDSLNWKVGQNTFSLRERNWVVPELTCGLAGRYFGPLVGPLLPGNCIHIFEWHPYTWKKIRKYSHYLWQHFGTYLLKIIAWFLDDILGSTQKFRKPYYSYSRSIIGHWGLQLTDVLLSRTIAASVHIRDGPMTRLAITCDSTIT